MEEAKNSAGAKKAGVVAIIGRPSAGKSTFLNTACGAQVSIVSEIPQTTRDAIRGIVNTSLGQLVFIDTPGCHNSEKKLNLRLRAVTESQLKGADAVLYIVDGAREAGDEERSAAALARKRLDALVVAINKIDSGRANIPQARAFVSEALPEVAAERVVEMSAKGDQRVDDVLRALLKIVPEGAPLYPEGLATDQDIPFRIAEIIRGEAMRRVSEELPHCLYVDVADAERRDDGKRMWVRAFVCVERDSQKGILIGKGASKIKEIRAAALDKCHGAFDFKIDLDLQVKVDKNWRQKDAVLKKIIK